MNTCERSSRCTKMNTCSMIRSAQRRCERQRSRALTVLADARLREAEVAPMTPTARALAGIREQAREMFLASIRDD